MTSHNLQKMLAEANAVIDTISVHDALTVAANTDTVFVDIRATVKRQQKGIIPGAVHAPRGFLEFIADPQGPMHNDIFFSGKRFILFARQEAAQHLLPKH